MTKYKRGETFCLNVWCKDVVLSYVSEVIFALNQSNAETETPTLKKIYPDDGVTAEQTDTGTIFHIPLNQTETLKFNKKIFVEGQIAYTDSTSVSKTVTIAYDIDNTTYTTVKDDNAATVGQANCIPMTVAGATYLNVSFETVENNVALSQAAADEAVTARDEAETYKIYASNSATAASQSAIDAENAKQAIEDMTVSATTLDAGSDVTTDKTFNPDGTVNIAYGIPRGDTGEQGIQGIQGNAGPNEVTTSTATNITGLLKGNGANIQQAVAGEDYPEDTITPVATYIHDSNPEIYVTAVDVNTNTFTSVGHGLSNGNTIYPIINQDAGNVYPLAVYAGGLVQSVYGYYAINATTDTFQLSTTSGGASIDVTENTNMDLTKWHFEKSSVNASFIIDNLPARNRYKVRVSGRILQNGAGTYVLPNSIGIVPNWLNTLHSSDYNYGNIYFNGDMFNSWECNIDYSNILSIKSNGLRSSAKTSTTNLNEYLHSSAINFEYQNTDITTIQFLSHNPANGYKVEVYAV